MAAGVAPEAEEGVWSGAEVLVAGKDCLICHSVTIEFAKGIRAHSSVGERVGKSQVGRWQVADGAGN